jgi:F-type H+-transporting ATPase subunit epsilon
MSRTLKISIIRPGRPPYNTEGTSLTIPSYDGYLGILYDRKPLLSLMKEGLVTITNVNGKKTYFAVSGGFAEVENNSVTLLCDSVVTSNDVSDNNQQETSEKQDSAPKFYLKDASQMNESEKYAYLVQMLRNKLNQETQKAENKN